MRWRIEKGVVLGWTPSMGLSDPKSDSLEIIALKPVKNIIGIKPMGLSAPLDESLDFISLKPV